MLYGRHLGYKGNFEKALAEHDEKALELFHNVEEVKQEAARFMKVKAVWQFFEAERDGNAIHLFAPGGHRADPHFPLRPPAPRRRPLPERLHPGRRRRQARSPRAVRGDRGRRRPREERRMEEGGRVLQSARHAGAGHRNRGGDAPSGCTAASAKTGASPTRPPSPCTTASRRKYHGKRYSFGYPACPNLDDQQGSGNCSSPRISACS